MSIDRKLDSWSHSFYLGLGREACVRSGSWTFGLATWCGVAGVSNSFVSHCPLTLLPASVPSPGRISTPNSGLKNFIDEVVWRWIFASLSPYIGGKGKVFLIFYSGTVFWLHYWGYFERSPPPTLTPKQ